MQSELSLVDYYLGLEGFLMIHFSHHVTVRQLDMFVVVRWRLIVFALLVGSHFARILLRVCNCSVHKISEISWTNKAVICHKFYIYLNESSCASYWLVFAAANFICGVSNFKRVLVAFNRNKDVFNVPANKIWGKRAMTA